MESRRKFLKASAAAMAVAATKPLFGIQGANDRIRMAIIGCGNRGGRVFDAVCPAVERPVGRRRRGEQGEARRVDDPGAPDLQAGRGRRLPPHPRPQGRGRGVDRTPDHWHSQQTIDAISAGKDVYVEKPASNTVPRLNAMFEAYKKGKQVVQVGTQQRSWDHFIEAKKFLDSGALGNVTHVYIVQPGSYARPRKRSSRCPAGLDWDMWQGPARSGRSSRAGSDSGVVRLRRRARGGLGRAPCRRRPLVHERRSQGAGPHDGNGAFMAVPDADPEQVPDTFSISWLYDNFLMTFANGEVYMAADAENKIENWGVFFIGNRGSLQVKPPGYASFRRAACDFASRGPPPPPTAGGARSAPAATAIAPALSRAGAPGRWSWRWRRTRVARGGGEAAMRVCRRSKYKVYVNPSRRPYEEDYPLDAHVQNFLECMKSRKKPNADMEIGYYAALPACSPSNR
jgi:hypothetical protein